MWICERRCIAAAVTVFLVGAGVDCGGGSGDCFRYSDCAQGLTCADGRCVAPPAPDPSDGGSVSSEDGGSASTESGTFPSEASGDDGAALGDANIQGDDAPAE